MRKMVKLIGGVEWLRLKHRFIEEKGECRIIIALIQPTINDKYRADSK